ncbi:hypothetical protein BDZ91DRAFT_714574 [Kalaharituber pfeilii]|nr:hypothetical protein BDZ91DRAFT_714574 [Kalaharituber pfeilii]
MSTSLTTSTESIDLDSGPWAVIVKSVPASFPYAPAVEVNPGPDMPASSFNVLEISVPCRPFMQPRAILEASSGGMVISLTTAWWRHGIDEYGNQVGEFKQARQETLKYVIQLGSSWLTSEQGVNSPPEERPQEGGRRPLQQITTKGWEPEYVKMNVVYQYQNVQENFDSYFTVRFYSPRQIDEEVFEEELGDYA